MADDRGNPTAPLAPEFLSPWATNVFHEIHRLELDGPAPGMLGRSLQLRAGEVRLGQRFSLEPAELHADPRAATFVQAASLLTSPAPPIVVHHPRSGSTGGEAGGDRETPVSPRLFDSAFGLLGLWGPMPAAWTLQLERSLGGRARSAEMAALPSDEEGGFSRFLDIFHHRLMLARYRAWADARPTTCLDREGRDPFSQLLSAWSGEIPGPATAGERAAGSRQEARTFGPPSAAGLAALVAERLDAPVRVEEFVGEWLTIEPEEQLVLGADRPTGILGGGAMLGERSWERQSRFRLHVGPVDARTFAELIQPESALAASIRAVVSRQVGPALRWDVWVRGPASPAARVQSMGGTQLGRTAFFAADAAPVGLDDWEDRIVDIQGGVVRSPGEGERFNYWTPSARLRDIKTVVDDALEYVFGRSTVGAEAAADAGEGHPGCSLERALAAASWAAIIGARSLHALAEGQHEDALRWFLDLDHVADPVPLAGLARRLETTSRGAAVRRYVRVVLTSLRRLGAVQQQEGAELRRLAGIPE
jgi:type VI secretion system protein ImpH